MSWLHNASRTQYTSATSCPRTSRGLLSQKVRCLPTLQFAAWDTYAQALLGGSHCNYCWLPGLAGDLLAVAVLDVSVGMAEQKRVAS